MLKDKKLKLNKKLTNSEFYLEQQNVIIIFYSLLIYCILSKIY